MKSLKLKKFKAFNEEISISLDEKNLLLYGENGAGKSSIYEAIKVVFYHQRLESNIVSTTPEDQQQKRRDFWSNYNNKIDNLNFEIQINDLLYSSFSSLNYQVYMISLEELKVDNSIKLKDLVMKFYFSTDDVAGLCSDGFSVIQEEVNDRLKSFGENVQIVIDEEEDYTITITDSIKNVASKLDIKNFFNEAKINTIVLLILLSVVKLSIKNDKKQILVLDDFITSLDSSNRTFLIKYILEDFKALQVLIFTHNISFYNLVAYMCNTINETSANWLFANLYEINNNHRIYFKNFIDKAEAIRNDYKNLILPHVTSEIDTIGNRIRKKFEVLLYEYSKLLMIGAVEDSNKIIERIMNGKNSYYHGSLTASDLLDKLQGVLNQNNPHNLTKRLQDKIDLFKNNDFQNFQKIIKELKLYQKVSMHPLSHGIEGMPTFTTREIEKSIDLIEKMEEYLKGLVDSNVTAV